MQHQTMGYASRLTPHMQQPPADEPSCEGEGLYRSISPTTQVPIRERVT